MRILLNFHNIQPLVRYCVLQQKNLMKFSLILLLTAVVLSGSCRSDDENINPHTDNVTILDSPPREESDPFELTEVSQQGDAVVVVMRYGGGCKEHLFSVYWDGSSANSLPPQISIDLYHDDRGDTCEAYPTDTVRLNLNEVLRGTWNPTEELRLFIRNAHNRETLSLLVGGD